MITPESHFFFLSYSKSHIAHRFKNMLLAVRIDECIKY